MPNHSLTDLVAQVTATFQDKYSSVPEVIVAAPGRVNLIGEHIDYNDGYVLPMAIERYTVIAARRDDSRIGQFYSVDMDSQIEIELNNITKQPTGDWTNYVAGVLAGMIESGSQLAGFKAVTQSNVPIGGGLSSSASLEVAVATLVEALTQKTIRPEEKGLVCQKAEHGYVGVPCGIMDQFSSVLCKSGHLLLLDCMNQSFEHIPFENPDISVLIINSKVKHELSGGEYAQRRAQCDHAASVLGVESFRGVTWEQVEAKKSDFEPVVYNRAKHVVTEIARTTQAAEAFKNGQWETVGQLMFASHQSLRDDFGVSCRELDILVDIASNTEGVIGSRMTGGGFGGCTVTLVESDRAEQIKESICTQYEQQTGVKPTAFITRPARGAHIFQELPGRA